MSSLVESGSSGETIDPLLELDEKLVLYGRALKEIEILCRSIDGGSGEQMEEVKRVSSGLLEILGLDAVNKPSVPEGDIKDHASGSNVGRDRDSATIVDANSDVRTEETRNPEPELPVDEPLELSPLTTKIIEYRAMFLKLKKICAFCSNIVRTGGDEAKSLTARVSEILDAILCDEEEKEADPKMELSVKTLDSQTHVFKNVDGEISVTDFKSLISPTVALPPEQQRLIFRGRVLQNEKKLKDYDVVSGQVLHLVGRNPANSSAANDQPSAANMTNGGGGGGGRNNAIIMGTIETMDLPGAQGQGPPIPRRTAASVRLQVASENMNRAGRLLESLEQELTLRVPEEAPADPTEDDEEDDLALALGHHAAVVASIRRAEPTIVMGNAMVGVPGPTTPTAASTASTGNATDSGAAETNTGTGNNTNAAAGSATEGSTGRQARRHSRNPEAPMLRELATSINDLLALNERLSPHLRTVERWLRQNAELAENQTNVQYTYNTVSSVLHSLSHSLHALSDITVDFSLPPTTRRLRAPTSILVEQSTVLRATIPVGLQVGIGGPGDMGGAQVLGINLEAPGMMGGQAMNVNALPTGLQQAFASMIQGAMFPNARGAARPPAAAAAGQPTQPSQARAGAGDALNMSTGGRVPAGPTEQVPWVFPPGPPVQTNQSTPSQNNSETGTPSAPAAPTAPAAGNPAAPTAGQAYGQTLQSLMGSMQSGGQRRRRDILLNCHSQHYNRAPPTPARPVGLTQFLSQEMGGGPNPSQNLDREYFDMLLGFTQILNTAHPAMIHYVQGNLLRGRDSNNPSHVLTAVRSYARRFAQWIVGALPAQSAEIAASLNANLADVSAEFLAKLVESILNTPVGTPITTSLQSLVHEWLPKFIDVFSSVFSGDEYKQILKGVIYLIVAGLFPNTPITFRGRLTAVLAQYLTCFAPESEEMADEPVVEPSEIEMGIDMEIEVGSPEIVESERSTPVISSSETRSPAVERIDDPVPASDDSDEDLQNEYQSATNELLQHLPSSWHRTILTDIERQEGLRNGEQEQPPFSPGFLAIFPPK